MNQPLVWYTGGLSVQFLPLPVPDPKQPWGSKECGFCMGHFLRLEKVLAMDSSDLPAAHTYPPTVVLLSRKVLGKLKRRAET